MNGELNIREPRAGGDQKKRSLQANEKENLAHSKFAQEKEKRTVQFSLDVRPEKPIFRRIIKSDSNVVTQNQRAALSDLQQNLAKKDAHECDNQLKKIKHLNNVNYPCGETSAKPVSRILKPTISSTAKEIQPKQRTQSKNTTQSLSNNAQRLSKVPTRQFHIKTVKQICQENTAALQKEPIETEGNNFKKTDAKGTTKIQKTTLCLPATTYTSTLFVPSLKKPGNEAKCKSLIKSASNLQAEANKKEFRPRTKSLNVDTNVKKPWGLSEDPFDRNEDAIACAVCDISPPLIITVKPIIQGAMSPIKPNLFTSETTLLVQNSHKSAPAKKKTLAHKTAKACSNRRIYESSFLHSDFYLSDYLEDIIQYILQNERRHMVGKDYLQTYDVNPSNRACIVNWLLKIQGQHKMSVNTYLLGIRLFDAILAAVHIPKNMYQLLSLTILWLTHKFDNVVRVIDVRYLVSTCCNAYSSQQILHMEQKVLKFFNFDCNLPEPTLYLFYYLKILDIKDEGFIDCTFYILQSYTLSEEYSTEPPSLLAATALRLTLEILLNFSNAQENIWSRLQNHLGYYDIKKIKPLKDNMQLQLQKINNAEYKYREAYNKYKNADWFQIFDRCLLTLPA